MKREDLLLTEDEINAAIDAPVRAGLSSRVLEAQLAKVLATKGPCPGCSECNPYLSVTRCGGTGKITVAQWLGVEEAADAKD